MLEVEQPRAVDGRAPDVFRPGKWVEMRTYHDSEEVDFAIVGTGAGGGTLACKLAEAGFSVVAFDAGPFWRPLEDFVSDENWQGGLFWTENLTSATAPVEELFMTRIDCGSISCRLNVSLRPWSVLRLLTVSVVISQPL